MCLTMTDDAAVTDVLPAEVLLGDYPRPMRLIAERLRAIVLEAAPDAIEAVRPGWRLIGYDVPDGRRTAYFAFVAPEMEHVHLGFAHGIFMRDPDSCLQGAGITKQVRWLTLRAGDPIDRAAFGVLVQEAARVARQSRVERLAGLLDDADRPDTTR